MYEQVQKIHDLAIKSIARDTLLPKGAPRTQLNSCLDVIGDSELAIAAYSAGEFGISDGARYLAVYGLLQALFIQQDAVINLCESLSIPEAIDTYPRLKEIREIRTASIGHPTKKDRPKSQPTSYHFIARVTLSPEGYRLLSIDSNGKLEFKDVSIPDLIADQRTYLSEILTSAIGKLEHDEKAHKEKFKMEKLVSFFPSTLGYAFEKVFEGTIERKHDPRGEIGLHEIKQAFQTFREALAKRGVKYESVNDVYALLEYPLAELEAFFENVRNGKELNINEKTAFIFAFFLQKQVDELISMAKEIDEDYSS